MPPSRKQPRAELDRDVAPDDNPPLTPHEPPDHADAADPPVDAGRTVRLNDAGSAVAAAVASHDENRRRAALRTYSIPLES